MEKFRSNTDLLTWKNLCSLLLFFLTGCASLNGGGNSNEAAKDFSNNFRVAIQSEEWNSNLPEYSPAGAWGPMQVMPGTANIYCSHMSPAWNSSWDQAGECGMIIAEAYAKRHGLSIKNKLSYSQFTQIARDYNGGPISGDKPGNCNLTEELKCAKTTYEYADGGWHKYAKLTGQEVEQNTTPIAPAPTRSTIVNPALAPTKTYQAPKKEKENPSNSSDTRAEGDFFQQLGRKMEGSKKW